jgi:hypothetical protein
MVLGVMSVGVNTPSGYEEPAMTAPPSVANRAGIFTQSSSDEQGQAETTAPLAPSYRSYQTPVPLSPENSDVNLPATNSPSKNLEIKLKLKSLEASITTPSTVLLLEVNDPLPEAKISAEPTAAVEPLLQGADTLVGDTLNPAVEPNLENILDVIVE